VTGGQASERARRQDDKWARYVEQLRLGNPPPFDEQWTEFGRIFHNRAESEGPPIAWRPHAELLERSNLARLIRDLGFAGYDELFRWSIRERDGFWQEAIRRLGFTFESPPTRILDDHDPTNPDWLPGARFNSAESCFANDPDRTAIVYGREGDDALHYVTYGELDRMSARFAAGFRAAGFADEAAVALYMPMTVECVAAYLGIVRAGGRVVSIPDSFSPGEVERRLEIGGAVGVVTVDRFVRGGRAIGLYSKVRAAGATPAIVIPLDPAEPPDLRDGDVFWADFLAGDGSFESVVGDPYRVINVLFSSGTTGTPKAVPWVHLTPIKAAMDGYFHQDIRPTDVVAWPTNIGWMMGPWLIYASFVNGATMALYEGLPTGEGFTRFVREARVSVLGLVPSLVRAWRSGGSLYFDEWPSVRVFSSTGEPSNREDYLWLMSRTAYRAPVIEYCGGTEIGGGYIAGTVVQPASPATFTTPTLGLDLEILNESGAPAAEGEMGEVFLVPPCIGLSQALLNRNHHEVYYAGTPTDRDGRPLRRHGDQMARLHHGFFKARGRADDTMNLGGIKVSSVELEQVLDRHPEVYESAAVAVQPEGEGAEQLVVYAVVREGTGVDRERLLTELSKLLKTELNPLFKIFDLQIAESLPRTASNKLMRRKLRAAWKAPEA
jgi:acetyl-CoA synthetase